jgi:hypothetical protein
MGKNINNGPQELHASPAHKIIRPRSRSPYGPHTAAASRLTIPWPVSRARDYGAVGGGAGSAGVDFGRVRVRAWLYLVLDPALEIVAASDSYLRATMAVRGP